MLNIQANSLKIKNPEHRNARIKNDLKYSWATGTIATLGTAAAFVGYERPDLYVKGFNNATNWASAQLNKLTNSSVGKKALEFATKIKNSATFGKLQTKIKPVLTSLGNKLSGLKTELGKLGKNITQILEKIPTNYKIAGIAAAITLAVLCKLSNNHSYNEGRIDERYAK